MSQPLVPIDPVDRLVPAPNQVRILAWCLLALYVVLAASLVFVPWRQNVRGVGRVVAYVPVERQQTIQAPIEGRVRAWMVREGTRVRKGDRLVELVDNDPDILARLAEEREAQRARLAAARDRAASIGSRIGSLGASRRSALGAADARAKMAADRVAVAERAVEAGRAQARAADLHRARQETLFADGLTSRRTLEVAEAEAVRARTDVDRARAQLSAARSDEGALLQDLLKAGTDGLASVDDARATRSSALGEVAAAEAELARLEVRLARQRAQVVLAPRDGTVLKLLVADGSALVKAGDGLAVLVPDTDDRAVELWLDGNDIPLVQPGRDVRVQFEGWPAVQFSGWPQVSVGSFAAKVALVDAADDGKGKFRIVVRPSDAAAWPDGRWLRQGTRANGWVMLEEVRLGYELWRQMNGFPPATHEPPALLGPSVGGK